MKVERLKDGRLFLRIKIAEGELGDESFVVSMISNGSGVVIEFDDAKYIVSIEDIVKEVMRFRGEEK